MTQRDYLKRELKLLQEIQLLKIDNNILRTQRDEWKAEAHRREGR